MAAGANLIYDTNTLVQVVPNLKLSTNFLLDKFFPNIVMADSEYVAIDVDIGKRRMAPFVSPLVEGKIVEQRRYQTNVYKPPYIKDKRAPDLRKPVRRMIGERFGGEMSGAEREMANLEAEMTDQIDILNRRLEWMAAQALLNGTVTMAGDGFPTVVIDFGRDPSLTVTNAAGAQWTIANITAGTASPTTDIEKFQRTILKKSGATVTQLIFTTSAWEGFIADPLLKGAIYYPKLGEAGPIQPGPEIAKGGMYKGRWGGYDLWIYNEWCVDPVAGTEIETPMLADGSLIMSGPEMLGTRAFGVIFDPAFAYAPIPYAPKTWVSEDPPQRYIMMASSPMVIPARINACLGANVCPSLLSASQL